MEFFHLHTEGGSSSYLCALFMAPVSAGAFFCCSSVGRYILLLLQCRPVHSFVAPVSAGTFFCCSSVVQYILLLLKFRPINSSVAPASRNILLLLQCRPVRSSVAPVSAGTFFCCSSVVRYILLLLQFQPVHSSVAPVSATLEGSSSTSIMTCTGGCGYSF